MFKKYILVSFLALALVVGVGASTANAALTLEALAITSDGALALNSTDWDISATGVMTGIGAITADGALILSGGTGASNALATIGTLATVAGFRAIDARVTDNGTAANAVAVQGLTTKASGVSTGEAWTGNFILTMTGGKYYDVFFFSSFL